MEKRSETSILLLPPELLEEIFKFISFREIGYVIKDVNRQFKAVAYNIFQKEFKNLSKRIEKKLDSVVRAHQLIQDEATDFAEQRIKIMTRYTLLKILNSEYHLLSLLWHKALNSCFLITTIMGEILDEFNSLMKDTIDEDWNWKCRRYVTKEMVTLLNLNYIFFYELKNKYMSRFGTHVLEILASSIQSSYELSISYDVTEEEEEDQTASEDSWCTIFGIYEIQEASNTFSAPPSGLRDSDSQILAHYLHDTIRWGNLIHSYKLRWNYMNQAIIQNDNRTCDWPFKNALPFCKESITDGVNGRKHIFRKVKRHYLADEPNEIYDYCFRCKFQIRCKANEISSELLHKNYKNILLEESNDAQENLCSENVSETNDYQFNMELSVKVRSYRQPYDHKEYKIWVQENESTIKITNNMKHFD